MSRSVSAFVGITDIVELYDSDRDRTVTVYLWIPSNIQNCTSTSLCPAALLLPCSSDRVNYYQYLANALSQEGVMVAVVKYQHTDTLASSNIQRASSVRAEWRRGATDVQFVQRTLQQRYSGFDWNRPILIGHREGGDIVTYLTREMPGSASMLITLDNQHVPLPLVSYPQILAIRSGDRVNDAKVLPSEEDRRLHEICITRLTSDDHRLVLMMDVDMEEPKGLIASAVTEFVRGGKCPDTVLKATQIDPTQHLQQLLGLTLLRNTTSEIAKPGSARFVQIDNVWQYQIDVGEKSETRTDVYLLTSSSQWQLQFVKSAGEGAGVFTFEFLDRGLVMVSFAEPNGTAWKTWLSE